MSWVAILPIKPRGQRKSRLAAAPDLDGEAIAARLLEHVCAVVTTHPAIAETILLAQKPESCGARAWREDHGRGLNAELAAARADLGGRDLMVILPDLPAVTHADIDRLIAAVGPVGAALAADRHGLGTNAVALRAGIPFTFHFGPASLAAHRAAAPAGARIVTTPGLGLDVDTPEDWTLSECGDPPAAAFLFVTEGQ